VPIIGDFHYNGHKLLVEYPEMAARWPSTASTRATSAPSAPRRHFATIVRVAIENDKPVRIGVNWGSLDQDLLTS
jgi:(E)-4-hydroxy-3-methylbut-2-enyl-diphosphate synthase